MFAAAKVTSKGQITLPCKLRNEMGINPGDTVFFDLRDGNAVMRKPKNLMSYLGVLGNVGMSANEEDMITPEVAMRILARE